MPRSAGRCPTNLGAAATWPESEPKVRVALGASLLGDSQGWASKRALRTLGRVSTNSQSGNPTDTADAMLDLFQSEVLRHTESIAQSIPYLLEGNERAGLINNHIRSFHSIRGAARIVGLHPFAELAHSMEDWFYEVLQGQAAFDESGLETLRDVLGTWERIRSISSQTLPDWTESHRSDFVELTRAVRDHVQGRHGQKQGQSGSAESAAKSRVASPAMKETASSPPAPAAPATSTPTAEPPAKAPHARQRAEIAAQAQDPVVRLTMHSLNQKGIAATRELFFHVFDGVPRPVVLDFESIGDIEADGVALLADFARELRDREWEKPQIKNAGAGTILLLKMTRLHLLFQWSRGPHVGA